MAMVIKSHRRERNTKLKTKVFSLIALLKIPPTQCVVTHIAQTGFKILPWKDYSMEVKRAFVHTHSFLLSHSNCSHQTKKHFSRVFTQEE